SLFIIGHMGLFVYTQKGSIISMVDLPTTEIIEPKKIADAIFLVLFVEFSFAFGIGIFFSDFF
ncbi:MAG: hypothetical protein EGQ12_03275, partial [Streptococcus sp.]|nr:hypothetical protein [Streptococcus sp.]